MGCLGRFVWKVCLGFLGSSLGMFGKFSLGSLGSLLGMLCVASVVQQVPQVACPTPPCSLRSGPLPPIQTPLSPADGLQLSSWLHQTAASSEFSRGQAWMPGSAHPEPSILPHSRFTAGAAAAAAAAAPAPAERKQQFLVLEKHRDCFLTIAPDAQNQFFIFEFGD